MTPREKREIKMLVSGCRDPRQGVVGVRGVLYTITKSLAYADILGFLILMVLAAPLVIPLAIVGNHFFNEEGMFTGAFIGAVGFVVWVMRPHFVRKKVEKIIEKHDNQLCLWCQHPLSGLPTRGRCPECGSGYELENMQLLYKALYDPRPYEPAPKVVRSRKSRAWARAVRERTRA
jgi:hypothetical protein